ncbi:MAG: sigma-70 family RNA polymerase sigma factor [Planctomycetes bacterium]|nr:sigma-70 family RNA polymerase sigma factor [Planctomycetota bacterium]
MEWKTTSTVLDKLHDHADQTAWTDFVGHFRAPIVRFVMRNGLSASDAEDVAQETMMAFARNYRLNRYDRTKGRLKDWLFGIARNQMLQARKSRMLQFDAGGAGSSASESNAIFDVPDAAHVAWWEDEWERAVYERCLDQVRNEVTAQSMEIFKLLITGGISADEVAARSGVSTTVVYNVKSRVSRRIAELARKYQDC